MWHAGKEEKCIQSANRVLERKSLLGRPERRWVNNIKLDYKEIGWEGVDRIHQVAGPFVKGNGHLGFIKCGEYLDQLRNY
jgi:hypothetical protein